MHVQSVNYTSRRYHTKMCKEIGEWKYPVIGTARKGWFRPYHAQLHYDDWRLPEVCVPQFIKDIGCVDAKHFIKYNQDQGVMSVNNFFIRLLLWLKAKFGPWNFEAEPTIKQMYKTNCWRYNVLVGCVKDPIQPCKNDGKYKEVL